MIKDSQIQASSNLNPIAKSQPFLLTCIQCTKEIPSLTLNIQTSQLLSKCQCTKQSHSSTLQEYLTNLPQSQSQSPQQGRCEQHDQPSKIFCSECNTWLCSNCIKFHSRYSSHHTTTSQVIDIKCIKHSKDYQLYCNDCCCNICNDEECKQPHSKHFFYHIHKEIHGDYTQVTLDNITSIKKAKTVLFGEMIETEILLLMKKIERLRLIKTEIEEEMKRNEEKDLELKQFYQWLMFTKAAFHKHPAYQICSLINSFKINEKQISIEGDEDIEDKAKTMINYLKSNYVFKKDNNEEEINNFNDVPLKSKGNKGTVLKKRNDDDRIYSHSYRYSEPNENKLKDYVDHDRNDFLPAMPLRNIMKVLLNKGNRNKEKATENLRDIDLS